MGRHEIYKMLAKYDNECVDYPARKASQSEIDDMLAKSKRWMCSYT